MIDWTSWLEYGFMRNALFAVLIITPLFALLGTMIVNKKMAYFSVYYRDTTSRLKSIQRIIFCYFCNNFSFSHKKNNLFQSLGRGYFCVFYNFKVCVIKEPMRSISSSSSFFLNNLSRAFCVSFSASFSFNAFGTSMFDSFS